MSTRRFNTILTAGLALAVSTVAFAQDPEAPPAAPKERTFTFTVASELAVQLGGGIDGGGDFDAVRFDFGLSAHTKLDRDLDLTLNFGYSYAEYEFEGAPNFGKDPWDDIHTYTFGARLQYAVANDWSIFGGPIVKLSGESDADWGDSLSGGAFVGASVRLDSNLFVGAGLGVMSQLEDDVRLFPVLLIDWKITDALSLSTNAWSSASGQPSIELVYDLEKDWELAVGASYIYKRFRLDDDAFNTDGIGQERGIPFRARATYRYNSKLEFTGYLGVVVNGDLTFEDSAGENRQREDYDPAFFFGINGSYRF